MYFSLLFKFTLILFILTFIYLKKKIFSLIFVKLTFDEHEDFKACVNLGVMIKFQ